MPKGKGGICPNPKCKQQAFHDKGSYRECSTCHFIGWGWRQQVEEQGKGKGWKCPNCDNQTLHKIIILQNKDIVRRCGICDFSAIEPYCKEVESLEGSNLGSETK